MKHLKTYENIKDFDKNKEDLIKMTVKYRNEIADKIYSLEKYTKSRIIEIPFNSHPKYDLIRIEWCDVEKMTSFDIDIDICAVGEGLNHLVFWLNQGKITKSRNFNKKVYDEIIKTIMDDNLEQYLISNRMGLL